MSAPLRCLKDELRDHPCCCADCWPLPAVRMVGDLSARHLGRKISIPNLHQPADDFDAPTVTVTGKLIGLTLPGMGWGQVWVNLSPKGVSLDRVLPLTWPCEVAA